MYKDVAIIKVLSVDSLSTSLPQGCIGTINYSMVHTIEKTSKKWHLSIKNREPVDKVQLIRTSI